MTAREINPHRARELRATGMSWKRVAERLSIDAERRPGFDTQSVRQSVRLTFGTSKVRSNRWVPE